MGWTQTTGNGGYETGGGGSGAVNFGFVGALHSFGFGLAHYILFSRIGAGRYKRISRDMTLHISIGQ